MTAMKTRVTTTMSVIKPALVAGELDERALSARDNNVGAMLKQLSVSE